MDRPLTPNQQRCVERLRAFDAFAFTDTAAFEQRGRWRERAESTRETKLVVEIGCADAAFLARVAARSPSVAFVGLDWKYGDIVRAAERIAAARLTNVSLVRGRAQDLRRLFADGEVDEIWIFHPEPTGDRLFDEPLLLDARAALRDATSTLTLKTDHAGYYQSSLALLGLPQPDWSRESPRARLRDLTQSVPAASEAIRDAFDVAFTSNDFWNDEPAQAHVATRAFAGVTTTYEQRFVAKRRPIFYVELRPALRSAMEPMKPMEPMRPMEPMKPLDFGPPWWPASYGSANAAGGQNDVRYAYFGDKRRLLVEKNGQRLTFDTGEHRINGIAQSQGDISRLVFSANDGQVPLTSLRRLDD